MKFDCISIGDVTIDTFLFVDEAEVKCQVRRQECQICFSFGEKIAVQEMRRTVAGNACNNAVGFARLGFKTAIVAGVGTDVNGDLVLKKLAAEKVSTKFVKQNVHEPTNASTVLSHGGERTILVYHAPRTYVLPRTVPVAKGVYYTSVGHNHFALNRAVLQYIKKSGARLGYNPGTYQIAAGIEHMRGILSVTDTLFINKEEAVKILNVHAPIAEHMQQFHHLGVKCVVITDGTNGSYASDGTHVYHLGIPRTKVIERTGAGDSYATAFMAARLKGKTIEEAMQWGTANSSAVVMQVGPQAGLLTAQKINTFIKKYRIGKPKLC